MNKCCGKGKSPWHSHFWRTAVFSVFYLSVPSVFLTRWSSFQALQDHINWGWSKCLIVTDYKTFKQCWWGSNDISRLKKHLISQSSESSQDNYRSSCESFHILILSEVNVGHKELVPGWSHWSQVPGTREQQTLILSALNCLTSSLARS